MTVNWAAMIASVVFLGCAVPGMAQDWARTALEKSPRHGEWVTVKHGDRAVQAFVVYPETKGKAQAVVVIHEIFGLTDWRGAWPINWRLRVTLRLRRIY